MRVLLLAPQSLTAPSDWLAPADALTVIDASGLAAIPAASIDDHALVVAMHGDPDQLLQVVAELVQRVDSTRIAVVAEQPQAELLLGLMRHGIREVWPGLSRRHLDAVRARLSVAASAATARREVAAARCIGVLSAKGGDGGSFVAANLACALSSTDGTEVVLADMALPFGDVDIFVGEPTLRHDVADLCAEAARLDGELLRMLSAEVAPRLRLIPSLRDFDRLSATGPGEVARLVTGLRPLCDMVVLDLGSGMNPLALNLLDSIDQLAMVTTPNLPSLQKCARMLQMWERMGRPADRFSVVLNRVARRWDIPAEKFAETLGRAVDRQLPNAPEAVNNALLEGVPLVSRDPDSELAQAFAAWAAEISGREPPARDKPWYRRLLP